MTTYVESELTYVRACALSALADESAVGVEIRSPAGEDIAVCVAKSQGEVFAISDICSHADVNLSDGEVEAGTVECWLHGSRFDMRSGRSTGPPANRPVPTYPVKIDGDDVWVAVCDSVAGVAVKEK
jgi:3-phenylpropionate/trans-cinnamate dioxygenase ferredoxin subunit